MARQQHPLFHIALAPSDDLPGQMIYVECVQIVCLRYHTYIVLQDSPSTPTTTKQAASSASQESQLPFDFSGHGHVTRNEPQMWEVLDSVLVRSRWQPGVYIGT